MQQGGRCEAWIQNEANCRSLRKIFANSESVKYLYVDAHYDPTDEDEKVAFDSASDNLWNLIASTPGAKIEKTVV